MPGGGCFFVQTEGDACSAQKRPEITFLPRNAADSLFSCGILCYTYIILVRGPNASETRHTGKELDLCRSTTFLAGLLPLKRHVCRMAPQRCFRQSTPPRFMSMSSRPSGRLLTEGWITSAQEVEQAAVCAEGLKVNVYLNHRLTARSAAAQAVSSCCTDNVTLSSPVELPPLRTVPQLELQPEWLDTLAAAMSAGLPLYRATRAVHSCFVLRQGTILFACEDIGRHNALDKAVGEMLLQGVPLAECVLYTSGRVPVDMVRKAIRAGVPALVSKSMPTIQSLELAQEYGLQLVCGRKHPLTLAECVK